MSDHDRAERGEAAPPPPAAPPAAPPPAAPTDPAVAPAPATDGAAAVAPPDQTFPGVFVGERPPPPPRQSITSMLILTMFFFLMGNGNSPQIINDGDSPRVTELDIIREQVGEYEGYLNGTGNWTEPARPSMYPQSIQPDWLDHSKAAAAGQPFFTNITGGYRQAHAEVIDLLAPSPAKGSTFFAHQRIPSLNQSWWNDTNAEIMRGEYDWKGVSQWDMNLNERRVEAATNKTDSGVPSADDWNWVKGTVTLSGAQTMEYDVFGLHFVPNGTYELYGQPQHTRIDIRNIPRLYPDHHNETARLILAELKKELRFREHQLVTPDAKGDDPVSTTCPLLIYMSVPPLPPGVDPKDVEAYHKELAQPSGLLWSLPKPPQYWQNNAFGIVAIADQCGIALGIDQGRGVGIGDFLRKTINYAAYATLSQLLVLWLLVRQMESTRTPSTLAKVSMWTIILMGVSDTWIFSAHLAIGIYSDNKTSLPLLVPAFLIFCTAIVFGPRYAMLLHRIQAPERAPRREEDEEPPRGFFRRITHAFATHAPLRWLAGIVALLVLFQIILIPNVIPFILFFMHSTWVPQIWRNARRGSAKALQHGFVLGTSAGRLALPLYALACPDNVFFIENARWIWLLVLWQGAQILLLLAQDRFGPAFFLPKRFQAEPGYDYHPILVPRDEEAGLGDGPAESPGEGGAEEGEGKKEQRGYFEGGSTCSICMEEVDTRPDTIAGRTAYAVAPCHHLFHTRCLQQWMGIKTICPLCKRPLPPL